MKSTQSAASLFVTVVLLAGQAAQAQVTGALNDANTIVNQSGNSFNITGGTQAGTNLFHSFQQFGLDQGQIANFLANPSTQNILSRVVGGNASVINGLIQITGSTANLYLMNPAGIVFGPGASLNVAGSFTATTATGIGVDDRWFSALTSNNYASLIGTPNLFGFALTQPGAIINAGNLTVGAGQNITLLGGTMISTGTIAAPGGMVTIAAIPGENLVRITQEGSLLSLDLPLATRATLTPEQPLNPPSIPALLTGSHLSSATGMTVENGIVKLTGSGILIEHGDVVAKTVTSQSATLAASNNLTLVESQLSSTGNLNLLADNTVRVRDSVATPSLIQAGGKLTIQGDQNVDIFALNHSTSGLYAAGDMVLRANSIAGDAHYFVGGNLQFETLNGSAGSLFSPHDPIIFALGDVSIGRYEGASLHILAGGSVTLGEVIITGVANTDETIRPGNTTNLNATRTFGSLAAITRADGTPLTFNGTPVIDSNGNVQRINPTPLTIDGNARPTLDVRAGIDWAALGGLSGNVVIPFPLPPGSVPPSPPPQPDFSTPPSNANISIDSISISSPTSGVVLLTNQYFPNATLTGGAIQVNGTPIDGIFDDKFSSANIFVNGGSAAQNVVAIDSRNTITTGNIITRPNSVYLTAVGDISTGHIAASRPSASDATSAFLSSTTGNITVKSIDAGANGVDIRAAGVFQVTDSFTESLRISYATLPPIGSPLRLLLDTQGITPTPNAPPVSVNLSSAPGNAYPISIIARPDAPTDPVGFTVLNAPVTIRYGDGSRTLVNDRITVFVGSNVDSTTQQTPSLVQIQGGDAAFFGGPQRTAVTTTTPENYTVTFDGNLLLAERYQILPFPADANGIAGAIVIAAGQDNGFYSSIQNRVFSAVERPLIEGPDNGGNGGNGGGNPGGSSNPLDALRVRFNGEEGQVAQRQLTNQENANCNPSSPIAVNPNTTSGAEVRSPRITNTSATTVNSNCATVTQDDGQILKILEE